MTNFSIQGRRKQAVDASIACDVKDAFEGRRHKVFHRAIDAFCKGSRSGFPQRLIWALHQLDNIDDEADKKLFASYRERDKF